MKIIRNPNLAAIKAELQRIRALLDAIERRLEAMDE